MLPPVKYHVRGVVNRDIEHIVGANSRIPMETLGDLRGQVAACKVGAQQFQDLCGRFGAATVSGATNELLEQKVVHAFARRTETLARTGTHEAEGLLDHDNVNLQRSIRAHLAITKNGDRILFDFTVSDTQAQGAVNLGYAHGQRTVATAQ